MNDKVWQPEFDDEGRAIGYDLNSSPHSFQVWRKKENLLQDFPNCIPVEYDEDGIEEPTFMD